jgi:alpha-ketoglutarate-dependent taurine dioxygenase
MIQEITFEVDNFEACKSELHRHWANRDVKVFVLKANKRPNNIKSFYESIFKHLGTPVPLAEDVKLGDRGSQRTGEIWFEVRYDPKHPDAYRHSSNAQPLHTDGSYIPNFPSSTLLACEANAGSGGETTFIDSKDLVEILEIENPELLTFLLNTKVPHARSGDYRVDPIIRKENDDYFVNYNYYCISKNIDSLVQDKVNEFQEFLLNSERIKNATIGVKLKPGDGVFWRDNYCLHGRNSFVANQESERFIWKCAIDIARFY